MEKFKEFLKEKFVKRIDELTERPSFRNPTKLWHNFISVPPHYNKKKKIVVKDNIIETRFKMRFDKFGLDGYFDFYINDQYVDTIPIQNLNRIIDKLTKHGKELKKEKNGNEITIILEIDQEKFLNFSEYWFSYQLETGVKPIESICLVVSKDIFTEKEWKEFEEKMQNIKYCKIDDYENGLNIVGVYDANDKFVIGYVFVSLYLSSAIFDTEEEEKKRVKKILSSKYDEHVRNVRGDYSKYREKTVSYVDFDGKIKSITLSESFYDVGYKYGWSDSPIQLVYEEYNNENEFLERIKEIKEKS